MTVTLDKLRELAKAEGIGYFLAPDRPAILTNFNGVNGSYQVIMMVELDGRFLQLRTIGYGRCVKGHPHLEAVLRVLGEMDYRLRLTKFGWDPNDGEIVGYVDLWLEDATLTRQQFQRMLGAFLPAIDMARLRLAKTIETGVDPDGTTTGDGTGGSPLPPPVPERPIVV